MSARATESLPTCRGFLLPVLLVVLASGSALMLTARPLRVNDVERPRANLLQARRALLAHVSAYPESYGPQGAGPGHLPCPDTDRWREGSVSRGVGAVSFAARTRAGFSSDGPNPPCGVGPYAVGWLPRNISFPTHREAFHVEASQRFVYMVSTSAINNPARPLTGPSDAVIAAIIDPARVVDHRPGEEPTHAATLPLAVDAFARSRPTAMTVLTERDLFDTAAHRVAAWLIERQRDRNAASRVCRQASDEADSGERQFELTVMPSGERVIDEAAVLRWVADVPPNADCPGVLPASQRHRTAFGPLLSPEPSASTVDTARLELVPLARHWFVRDGWAGRLSITAEVDCLASFVCDLVRLPSPVSLDRHRPSSRDPLVLRLVQTSLRRPRPDQERFP